MLPILEYRDEIRRLIAKNQVVVICGDTGSGKTTQIPQICLEMGFGAKGRRIACTQPRRLAAITVAERVAKELQCEVGLLVGYQHRFARKVSAATRIKFMTDGVLLAETRVDRLLRQYDVIILDEAHERNLNVDFLLGILKRILDRRRDLKVIISSATLDTGHFAEFFSSSSAIVPTLQVPGRLFPIEMRYQEPEDEDADLPREVGKAVCSLPSDADTLVFLPGERDIRETADHLRHIPSLMDDEILPLIASLPAGEQAKVFHTGRAGLKAPPPRRIILATNVAETSVTIPGIRAVVDSGLARLSRYIHRTQVQRLQIERISQASARQRAGRCGRLGPGICIRLYSEAEYLQMEPYTPPEILRSSLSGVILSMLELKLGDIELFPFLDPPKPTMIREGLRELVELSAIEHRNGVIALTPIGEKLARMPVEPRLARMLIAADREASLPSVLPLVAAMSCDDPRRRPIEEREKAVQAHAKWRVPGSDFLSTLKLWNWWLKETKDQSQSAARRLAQQNYLAFMKMREWRDVARQLKTLCEAFHLDTEHDNGGADGIHRALLHGLLSRIGRYDPEERNYRGPNGLRFDIHPGSVLAKAFRKGAAASAPPWIMSGELVDTSRLFAREVSGIDPAWLEQIGAKLCRHHYHSPFWDADAGFVRALEDVTLFGLPLAQGRRCDYTTIDPIQSREIFIRRGVIDGAIPNPSRPILENNLVIAEMHKRAEKLRAPELFDEEKLYSFFNAAIPAEINTARELRKWLYETHPAGFRLNRAVWVDRMERKGDASFPDSLRLGDAKVKLTYRHCPDDPEEDGITCTVRKEDVGCLRLWNSDWLVPGALAEKVYFYLNALDAGWRKVLYPIDEKAAYLAQSLKPNGKPLLVALRDELYAHDGFRIPLTVWDSVKLPPHLQVRFRVIKEGKTILLTRDKESVLALASSGGGGFSPARPPGSAGQAGQKAPTPRKAPLSPLIREIRALAEPLEDCGVPGIEAQLAWMMFPGYEELVPSERLAQYPRYLKGAQVRLDRMRTNPSGDRSKEMRFNLYWDKYEEAAMSKLTLDRVALGEFHWLLEEYRIQLFAQELGTAVPVSPKRLDALWQKVLTP